MKTPSLPGILARAVRASMLVAVPAVSACGGSAIIVSSGDGGAGGDQGAGVDAASAACRINPGLPLGTTAGCGGDISYSVVGDCAGDAGTTTALDSAECTALCPLTSSTAAVSCSIDKTTIGTTSLGCYYYTCGTGRRPPGWELREASAETVGDRLAAFARLEAASVHAFRLLHRELRVLGAPRRLRDRAARSAREEVRHARVMTRLAARAGRRVDHEPPMRHAVRSLEAIARDNATEGCVRETFGAALAGVQATRASDPALRAALSGIARDEARHADFSWQLARWLEGRLPPAARRRVEQARAEAIASLHASIAASSDNLVSSALGMPTRAQALALFDALHEVWTLASC